MHAPLHNACITAACALDKTGPPWLSAVLARRACEALHCTSFSSLPVGRSLPSKPSNAPPRHAAVLGPFPGPTTPNQLRHPPGRPGAVSERRTLTALLHTSSHARLPFPSATWLCRPLGCLPRAAQQIYILAGCQRVLQSISGRFRIPTSPAASGPECACRWPARFAPRRRAPFVPASVPARCRRPGAGRSCCSPHVPS